MKDGLTEFLIKLFLDLAIATLLAVVIDLAVTIAGGDIGWWTAYAIATLVVCEIVLLLSLGDRDH